MRTGLRTHVEYYTVTLILQHRVRESVMASNVKPSSSTEFESISCLNKSERAMYSTWSGRWSKSHGIREERFGIC